MCTHMSHHFSVITKCDQLVAEDAIDLADPKHRRLLLKVLLKCADLCDCATTAGVNPAFFDKIYTECELVEVRGIPTRENDKDGSVVVDRDRATYGLLAYICLPLFDISCGVFPKILEVADQIRANMRIAQLATQENSLLRSAVDLQQLGGIAEILATLDVVPEGTPTGTEPASGRGHDGVISDPEVAQVTGGTTEGEQIEQGDGDRVESTPEAIGQAAEPREDVAVESSGVRSREEAVGANSVVEPPEEVVVDGLDADSGSDGFDSEPIKVAGKALESSELQLMSQSGESSFTSERPPYDPEDEMADDERSQSSDGL
jgi:hypothetical protein